jgi:hypothetical protein
MDPKTLAEEREYFAQHRSELAGKSAGKFVLIHGRELAGIFDTQAAAYAEGLKRFGVVPMLIVQVRPEPEQVVQFPALALGLISADLY